MQLRRPNFFFLNKFKEFRINEALDFGSNWPEFEPHQRLRAGACRSCLYTSTQLNPHKSDKKIVYNNGYLMFVFYNFLLRSYKKAPEKAKNAPDCTIA